MLQRVHAFSVDDEAPAVDPQAQALTQALSGCCHPRAARIRQRLEADTSPDEMHVLYQATLELLSLSFGPAEARERLTAWKNCAAA